MPHLQPESEVPAEALCAQTVSTRITPTIARRLRAEARQSDRTVSNIIRRILKAWAEDGRVPDEAR